MKPRKALVITTRSCFSFISSDQEYEFFKVKVINLKLASVKVIKAMLH